MATQHLVYKPQPVHAVSVAGATRKEHSTWQENVQETVSTGSASKNETRGIRLTLTNLLYNLMEILLPSRWDENNFNTPADRRPPVMIRTLGEQHLVFDGRHRRPDRKI